MKRGLLETGGIHKVLKGCLHTYFFFSKQRYNWLMLELIGWIDCDRS